MFQLLVQDIHPGAFAGNKEEAICQVATALVRAGCVGEGYVNGMLAREQQTSTWLGNGIAIPHGTTETRSEVLKTGAQVFQYPQGVEWGEGQRAYIVIGIAASSDEHLGLLRQLTHVLSNDDIAEQLKSVASAEEIRALLMVEKQQSSLLLDNSMLTLNVDASDMMSLQALNVGRLRQANVVDSVFVSQAISEKPMYLGQGIWLNDSAKGNLTSAIAISRPAVRFQFDELPVALLMTVSMTNEQPIQVLKRLNNMLNNQQTDQLFTADSSTLLSLLTQDAALNEHALSAVYTVRNEHGLHARPGTMLVNTIKQFTSDITVINLDGSGKPANGRSLMKVVSLGVKKGHRLRITANGDDAEQALKTIGDVIASGLGEGEK